MRKIIEFDAETYDALVLLARDSMSSLQELADEAFRDLLKKRGRPTSLKDALRRSLTAPPRRATLAKPTARKPGAKKAISQPEIRGRARPS